MAIKIKMPGKVHAFVLLLLFTFTICHLQGQTFKYKTTEASEIVTGHQLELHGFPDTLTVWSNDWNFITSHPTTWQNTFKLKSNNTFVKFGVDHFFPYGMHISFSGGVAYAHYLAYDIYGYDDPADTVTGYTLHSDTLRISYQSYGDIYQDLDMKKYGHCYKVVIVLKDILGYNQFSDVYTSYTLTSTPPVNINLQNFFVEGSILSQRYDKDKYGIGATPLLSTTAIPDEPNNLLKLFWNYSPGDTTPLKLTPVKYELEWTYVDDYKRDVSTGALSSLTPTSVFYDFNHNSTRVWVDSNFYRIPLVYNSGYVAYRVRAIKPDSVLFKYPVYGPWSVSNPSGAISTLPASCYHYIKNEYTHDSLNWQYTISFAEGGKYKQVASFYDGLLKNRQSITRFNTDLDKLIATQNVYDYEGRHAITTLPAPVRNHAFSYLHDVSLNSVTGLPFEAHDFDTGFAFCPQLPVIPPLATNALASIYYSDQNPDTADFQKFVPDAEGYPLVQTIVKPGYSDRIAHQGGAGPALQIGNSNSTAYYYVGASQPELDRLFGGNIGFRSFYNKTVTMDPNQQLSMSVKDYKGRQMVSALMGQGPLSTTHALTPVDVPASFSLRQDLLYGLTQTVIDNKRIADFDFFNQSVGPDSIQYFLTYNPYPLCPGQALGVKEHYHYDVIDQCGNIVVSEDSVLGSNGLISSPLSFSGNLNIFAADIAPYHVHKELTVDPVDVDAALDSFFNAPPSCFLLEPFFVRRAVQRKTFPCPAEDDSPCKRKKRLMMEDLRPGGKYAQYGEPALDSPNSIFSIYYVFVAGEYVPIHRYQDTCTVPSLQDSIVVDGYMYHGLRHMRTDSFINIYNASLLEGNDTLAEQLLPLHPEYCKLKHCFDDTFKVQVQALPDHNIAARYHRLLLDSLVANDPLVGVLTSLGMPSAADSLRTFKGGHIRLDSFVLVRAYCACSDSVMFKECVTHMYHPEIAGRILLNDRIKSNYFDMTRDLYFTNRERFIAQSVSISGDSCTHCAVVRMDPEGEPVFDPTITGTGEVVLDSLEPYGSFTGSTSMLWFGPSPMTAVDSMDSTMTALYDSAMVMYHFADSGLCYGQIDTILTRLNNCIAGDTLIRNAIRNTLDSLCAAHAAVNGNFTPALIRYAITRNGVVPDDLCNPYVVSYMYFPGGSTTNPQNCKPDSFFTSVTGFLDDTVVFDAFGSPGTAFYDTLVTTGSMFQSAIASILGGNTYIKYFAGYDAAPHKLTLFVFNDPAVIGSSHDTVKIFLRSPVLGNVFAGIADSFSVQAACIMEQPSTDMSGVINAFSFLANVTSYSGSTALTTTMLGWTDSIAAMNDMSNNLSGCIPCTQMRSIYTELNDTLLAYNVKGADHPYYYTMLTNMVNEKLRLGYSTDQYLRFVDACALADSMLMPYYFGYATFTFSSVADMNTFMTGLNAVDTEYSFNNAYRDSSSTGVITVSVNMNGVPQFILWKYRNFFNTYAGPHLPFPLVNTPFSAAKPAHALGFLYTPTIYPFSPSDSSITPPGDSVTYSATVRKVWQAGHFVPVTCYDVISTATAPQYRISRDAWLHYNYLYTHGTPYVRFAPYFQSTIDNDYFKPEKTDYLHYVYRFGHLPPYQVLDSIQAYYLTTRIPSYSGYTAGYSAVYNPNSFTNLYMSGPGMTNNYFDTLQYILQVFADSNTINPHHLFFDTSRVVAVTTPDTPVIGYRCSDGTYWYRYFGAGDTLYNAYVAFPPYIPRSDRKNYQVLSIVPGLGDSTTRFFSLYLQKPGDPNVIMAHGLTNFVIGRNIELDNVLLGRATETSPLLDPADTFDNCERSILDNAVAAGRQEYNDYVDSMRSAIVAHFREYFTNSVSERLELSYLNNEFGYTLYNYDRAGNLETTVPPMGVQPMAPSTFPSIDTARIAGTSPLLPTYTKSNNYYYNTRNQVMNQNTIDAGATFFYYDPAGRLILTQNAKQMTAGGYYTYFIYDKQSRVVETGQAMLGAPSFPSYSYDVMASIIRSHDRHDVVFTVYDTPATNLLTLAHIDAQENLRKRVTAVKYFDTILAADETFSNYVYATHYSYDIAGNVKTVTQDFPALEDVFRERYKRIDYDYDLISGKVNMLSYNRGHKDQYYQRYTYDADNRLTEASSSADGYIWKRDAAYSYYQHGPLARTELGDLRVQGIDFAYTIQGWLKAMNGDTMAAPLDMAHDGTPYTSIMSKDVAAYTIDYFTNDYKPIGAWQMQHVSAVARSLYNGNISRQTMCIGDFRQNPFHKQYEYDQFNRLKNASYFEVLASTGSITPVSDYYNSYDYDLDGNIKRLIRHGDISGSSMLMDSLNYYYFPGGNRLYDVQDSAANSYPPDLDIQQYTTLPGAPPRYAYDDVGNTTMDLVNGQNSIKWNIYNKVVATTNDADSSSMKFIYDGMGNRVAKIHTRLTPTDSTINTDYYVHDAQGSVLAVYRRHEHYIPGAGFMLLRNYSLAEHTLFGSSRLGVKRYFIPKADTLPQELGARWDYRPPLYPLFDTIRLWGKKPWYSLEYQDGINADSLNLYGNAWADTMNLHHVLNEKAYEITDHLGNVLVTIADGRKVNTYDSIPGIPLFNGIATVSSYQPVTRTESDYYPFGMRMPTRDVSADAGDVSGSNIWADASVQRWMPVSTHFFNGGCAPCGIDTMNRSVLNFGAANVTVIDTYRATLPSAPLPTQLLYGNWMMRYPIHGLHPTANGAVRLSFSNINIPPASQLVLFIYRSDYSLLLDTAHLPTSGPVIYSHIFPTYLPMDADVVMAIGWQRLYDTSSMPYDYSFTLDSINVFYDTIEALPVPLNAVARQSNDYRYAYNGQMKNDEYAGRGHFYEYGVRGYDARTARFQRVDPLTQRFPWYTPYQFAGNSPILNIDLDGAEPLPYSAVIANATFGEGQVKHMSCFDVYYHCGSIATYPGWYRAGDYKIVSGQPASVSRKGIRAIGAGIYNLGHMNDVGWSFDQRPDWDGNNIEGSSIRHAIAANLLDATEAGGKTNAFNHAIWQGTITMKYGWMSASVLGDAHEDNPYFNIQNPYSSSLEFKDIDKADMWVDLQNNHLIRDIMKKYNGPKTVNGVALYVLDFYKNNGLWVIDKEGENKLKPVLYKINDHEYEKAKQNLQNLDDIYK